MIKTAGTAATKTAQDAEVVAVIISAIAAMGYSQDQISLIRPVVSSSWRLAGRMKAL